MWDVAAPVMALAPADNTELPDFKPRGTGWDNSDVWIRKKSNLQFITPL